MAFDASAGVVAFRCDCDCASDSSAGESDQNADFWRCIHLRGFSHRNISVVANWQRGWTHSAKDVFVVAKIDEEYAVKRDGYALNV